MSLGFFLTIEGIDGSGKSTQAGKVVSWIRQELGRPVVWTREPGGWGDGAIRDMLIRGNWANPYTEMLLFFADRCEHCSRVITPAILDGAVVVCERYQDSTVAYQSFGMGLPESLVVDVFSSLKLPLPTGTLWLDISPEDAMARLSSRGGGDRIEARGLEFFRRVREGYRAIAVREPERFVRIPASGDPEEVFQRLKEELVRMLCS
ncbi:MAG: dTMP kinase [Thermanaerothrix sp.]|nr:dTMP kinase [Thermanaerothrix sp.]